MTPLAKRVIEARGDRTQAEFARLIGISRSALNQIESGDSRTMKAKTAFAMEDRSGYSARWLLLGVGPKRISRRPEDAIPDDVLTLAMKIWTMSSEKRELLLSIFSEPVKDGDPRLDGWKATR